MSRNRIAPKERFQQPKERGPNGRPLCRGCHAEVPRGRRAFEAGEVRSRHTPDTPFTYERDEHEHIACSPTVEPSVEPPNV